MNIAAVEPSQTMVSDAGAQRIALRTGNSFLGSIDDGRQIYIHGRKLKSFSDDPELAKSARLRADIYDTLLEPDVIKQSGVFDPSIGAIVSRLHTPPRAKADWYDKLALLETMFRKLRYIPARTGDETIPAVWSMMDGLDFIGTHNAAYAQNIQNHLAAILRDDPYHVSGNADPKSNRALSPSADRPSVLLHAVKETSAGVVVRGAKYETGAAYANQAFIKPTVGDWSNKALAPYAIGFLFDRFDDENVKIVCRDAYSNVDRRDFPLSGRADEIEAMVVFDNVTIPWENIFFHNDVEVARFVRGTLHRYSVFMFTARLYFMAKLYLGVAYLSTGQCGLTSVPQVREKLSELVSYKEMAHAFLVSSIETGSLSPAGFWMPNQAMMLSGRHLLSAQLPDMMQTCRELCGGQGPCTAGHETFAMEEIDDLARTYYQLDDEWTHDRRHRLIALSNDLLNSRYATSRLNFYMFAHSPPFAQKNAIFTQHDFSEAQALARLFAGL